jgi:uncharacterized protein (DUF1330 family)
VGGEAAAKTGGAMKKLFTFGAVVVGAVVAVTGLSVPNGQAKPHAFIVAEVDVHDSAAYRPYAQRAGQIVAQYGGHYIVRGGKTEAIEGAKPANRIAIIEFPSLEALDRFESSPEYRAVVDIRHKNATSRVFAVEGVSP